LFADNVIVVPLILVTVAFDAIPVPLTPCPIIIEELVALREIVLAPFVPVAVDVVVEPKPSASNPIECGSFCWFDVTLLIIEIALGNLDVVAPVPIKTFPENVGDVFNTGEPVPVGVGKV
jgi:hypothetical protein